MNMSRQAWAFLAAIGSVLLAMAAILIRESTWALLWSLAAVVSWMTVRRWQRISPVPFPYAFRWLLQMLPRPTQSLAQILQPRNGEHLLEIGPGVGTDALAVASALCPDGMLHVLDVQQDMLDAVVQRARAAGVTNIECRKGDAARLPYANSTFDGAYLITVLGEIPDGDGALRELARVLKPTGRLVIGEALLDPDFVSLRRLRTRTEEAGFVFVRKVGGPGAYLARFVRGLSVHRGFHDAPKSPESITAATTQIQRAISGIKRGPTHWSTHQPLHPI